MVHLRDHDSPEYQEYLLRLKGDVTCSLAGNQAGNILNAACSRDSLPLSRAFFWPTEDEQLTEQVEGLQECDPKYMLDGRGSEPVNDVSKAVAVLNLHYRSVSDYFSGREISIGRDEWITERYRSLESKAWRLLQHPGTWAAVTEVAKELMERRSLCWDRVSSIARRHRVPRETRPRMTPYRVYRMLENFCPLPVRDD